MGVWVVAYLSDKEDDGEELYTGIKVFETKDKMVSYLRKEGWTTEEIEDCIDATNEAEDDSFSAAIWFEAFS